MRFGADYYPEHWQKSEWPEQIEKMKLLGINCVRMAEFAWDRMEPESGKWDFSWLDEAMAGLKRAGIDVILGTPTATPPKWLCDEIAPYMRDQEGKVRGFGTRRHYCYNHPRYKEYTERIVRQMARHYADDPQVIAWQIDNEFGCGNTTYCYCEHCRKAFGKYLEKKFGTVEAFNDAMGLDFWSQRIQSFDQIWLPGDSVTHGLGDPEQSALGEALEAHSPSLQLEYRRFCTESIVEYQRLQIETLRQSGVKVPITHNFMGHFNQIDYRELAKDLDFVSWDNYPLLEKEENRAWRPAMAHEIMRGVKDKNFWVMEQQAGPCGWQWMSESPRPGQLRLWTHQALAHGAQGMVYFRFQTCRMGTEQYWYGILDHDGVPRRRFYEIQKVGQELQRLSPWIEGSRSAAQVLLVRTYDNLWAHAQQYHAPEFSYGSYSESWYRALTALGLTVNVSAMDGKNLSDYPVVALPAYQMLTDEEAAKLEEYVKNGGILITGLRSGTRDGFDRMVADPLPGKLRGLTGVTVEEFNAIPKGKTEEITLPDGSGCKAFGWSEILSLDSAESLMTFADGWKKGMPAAAVKTLGSGKAAYLGAMTDDEGLKAVFELLTGSVERPPVSMREGLEIVSGRSAEGEKFHAVMNHTPFEKTVEFTKPLTDILTGGTAKNAVLTPWDAQWFKEEN